MSTRAKKLTSIADGRTLAIRFLYELRKADSDASRCTSWCRDGKPQKDLLGPYLRKLREAGPEVESGFLFIMNDVLGGLYESVSDPEFYDRLERENNYDYVPEGEEATS